MTSITKVAILTHEDTSKSVPLEEIVATLIGLNIVTHVFAESDSIMSFRPDCVLVTSPQHAKLTPFPTYGFINRPRDDYLSIPRFLRNILTYDGYFTVSPRLNMLLRDIMFGARKLSTSILKFDLFPAATEFKPPVKIDPNPQVIIFENDLLDSKFQPTLNHLLEKMDNVVIATNALSKSVTNKNRYIQVQNNDELTAVLKKYPIAISLYSGDEQEQTLDATVMKLIASGAVVIAHHTKQLENYFGDNLFYIPKDTDLFGLPAIITNFVARIVEHPADAIQKSRNAHQIFLDNFAFDRQFPKLVEFHNQALIDKCYVPNPDPAIESALPSVTYIMRTGGKNRPFLERTLDCLVAQRYPDLRVLFVIHARFDYMHDIIAQYPSLKIKVVVSIKSKRSEAIRDGMAVIETDLFGLFDDDDELFPNHVRSLVKTMHYHTNRDWRGQIGMVYSGSIHADDTHLVEERVEFRDDFLSKVTEKRAIEHFRFYSSVLMSSHAWFMPNGWLARKTLIDDELLVDPELDTCEDLYFELQIAQKTHLAFSVEVTAVHNFHHLGNSTIDDSWKHIPDTQRIALRNFMRVFPTDSLYDTHYNLVGKTSEHDPNQLMFMEHRPKKEINNYYINQFYPFRQNKKIDNELSVKKLNGFVLLLKAISLRGFLGKFIKLSSVERKYYFDKFKLWVKQYGVISAVKKTILFFVLFKKNAQKPHFLTNPITKTCPFEVYYRFRVKLRYKGFWQAIKSALVLERK